MDKPIYRSPEGRAEVHSAYEKILEGWPVECRRNFIPVNSGVSSVNTHIIECGRLNAPILILLHGTSSNSAAWMGDVKKWSESFRIFAIDIPGQPGLSEDIRFSPGSEAFRLWLRNAIESCTQGEKVSIVGQSLGGFAALQYAVICPDKVRALSLLTASGLAPARMSFIFRVLPLMLLGDRGMKRVDRLICYKTDTGADAAAFGSLVSKHFLPLAEPIPVFTDEELGVLGMPVQYFGGDHDVLLNTEKSADRLAAQVPGAEINILPDTGHVILGHTSDIEAFLLKTV